MTKPAIGDGELLIHLDVPGLAALMKAIEAAMAEGRGQLILGSGGTVVGSSDSPNRFNRVTVTFAASFDPSDDAWRTWPDPEPRAPVLELQD